MHLCALSAAKNLILAGVKSVTLHDEGTIELWDLSSNFIFTEDDIGKNRALASLNKMQELNSSVVISTLTTELTAEDLSEFQVIFFISWYRCFFCSPHVHLSKKHKKRPPSVI
ncbi:putative THIF-type NAD/FAD binding, ubiquitin-activating enzyme [Helianthus debilis subsp. tardiflorus]